MNTTAEPMITGLRPSLSAEKNPAMQPKNAPAWKVETMFDDKAASSSLELSASPNARWNDGSPSVPPMKAESYPYAAEAWLLFQ